MGWDLTIINVVDGSKTIEEIGEDSVEPVGNRERVISLIKKIFPDANVSDSSWITVHRKSYSLEFSLSQQEWIDSFMVHIHGNDEKVVDAIAEFCLASGWSALDAAIGNLIDFSSDGYQEGRLRWVNYRNQTSR